MTIYKGKHVKLKELEFEIKSPPIGDEHGVVVGFEEPVGYIAIEVEVGKWWQRGKYTILLKVAGKVESWVK